MIIKKCLKYALLNAIIACIMMQLSILVLNFRENVNILIGIVVLSNLISLFSEIFIINRFARVLKGKRLLLKWLYIWFSSVIALALLCVLLILCCIIRVNIGWFDSENYGEAILQISMLKYAGVMLLSSSIIISLVEGVKSLKIFIINR